MKSIQEKAQQLADKVIENAKKSCSEGILFVLLKQDEQLLPYFTTIMKEQGFSLVTYEDECVTVMGNPYASENLKRYIDAEVKTINRLLQCGETLEDGSISIEHYSSNWLRPQVVAYFQKETWREVKFQGRFIIFSN